RPAIMRSKVVLPEPEGPSSAVSSPVLIARLTLSTATKSAKRLFTCSILMLISLISCSNTAHCVHSGGLMFTLVAVFDIAFNYYGDQRQRGKQRRHGKGGSKHIFVVQHFDMQRHGVGFTADTARHHGHGAKLTHCTGITQHNTVNQAPLDIGQGNVPEGF